MLELTCQNRSFLAEKPKVTLHARVQSGLCIKKGEEICIDAYISGSPYPKISWLRNDEDVTKEPTKKLIPVIKKRKKTKAKVCVFTETSESPECFKCFNLSDFLLQVPEPEEEFVTPLRERLGIDQTKKGQSAMMIRDAVRTDHGNFTIKVENTHGVATASCVVTVLGNKVYRLTGGHMIIFHNWYIHTIKSVFELLHYMQGITTDPHI